MEMPEKLAAHFHPKRIHWRVGSNNKGRTKPLCYLDARDVMNRLDNVCGAAGWQDSYEETPSGRIICELSIRFGVGKDWITKSDGAGSTGIEFEKGAISDAFKRAAVKFGIGRYLYYVRTPWIQLNQGKWLPDDFNGAQYLPKYEENK